MHPKLTPAAGLATVMMFASAGWHDDLARVMLSRVVEAHAAAMEANDLLAAGVIEQARYERAANDRDDAIEAAAAFLRRTER